MIQYNNGNSSITLFRDGTKIKIPISKEFPKRFETVDIKITDHCDAGCSYCHENSTTQGQDALFGNLCEIINSYLLPYTEIAIGGGNPLDYAELDKFLWFCKKQAMIPSITVNSYHINHNSAGRLDWFIRNGLIHNIGISYNKNFYGTKKIMDNELYSFRNKVVYHLIYGVNDIPELVELYDLKAVLVLGYKFHGRGKKGKGLQIVNNLPDPEKLKEYIFSTNIKWCFDTLAVEQLKLDKNSIFYMGDEGEHSLYIDAVKSEYSQCSYSEKRLPLFGNFDPKEFYNEFANNKKEGLL